MEVRCCSFCERSEREVAVLIAALDHGRPRAYICDKCVADSSHISVDETVRHLARRAEHVDQLLGTR